MDSEDKRLERLRRAREARRISRQRIKELDREYTYKIVTHEEGHRICLKCDNEFLSCSKVNRLCHFCREGNKFYESSIA